MISDWLKIGLEIAGVVAIILGGFFSFVNAFDVNRRRRQTDANDIDNRVISGLKDELTLQGGTIARMETDLRELRDSNLKLNSENKTLREILQGRDDTTIKYQAEGRVAMSQIKTIYDTQEVTSANLNKLIQAIDRFVTKETEVETHTTTTIHPKPQ